MMRILILSAVVLGSTALVATGPKVEAAPPAPVAEAVILEAGASCDAQAPAIAEELALGSGLEASAVPGDVEAMAKPGCKSCKDRPWCACTYNGKPRISCNPCCYQGWADPFPVCFD